MFELRQVSYTAPQNGSRAVLWTCRKEGGASQFVRRCTPVAALGERVRGPERGAADF